MAGGQRTERPLPDAAGGVARIDGQKERAR
jgi:hypothetical protein